MTLLVALALARPAGASSPSPLTAHRSPRAARDCATSPDPTGRWVDPLTRTVSLRAREISLREALDRLAARARIRLSYSAEALPLDRRVCLAVDSAALGDALTALLAGIPVRLVPLGSDHVVLAPVLAEAGPSPDPLPVQLERIVVTGTVTGASQRSLPIALDVLPGVELEQRRVSTVSEALNPAVPGIWAWEQSPASFIAQYGSIRGTSSFGTSYPKVYLDGIQLANPLLVTWLQPATIERIEVIRGPQGAALYGADAISGVTNIVSRHDAGAETPRARVTAGVGLAATDFAPDPALEQRYAAEGRTGSNLRSAALHLELGSTGEYSRHVFSRRLAATAVGRWVGGKSIVTGTVRFFGMRAGSGESPVITRLLAPYRAGDLVPAALAAPVRDTATFVEFTAGGSAKLFSGDHWQHTFTAGLDAYRLDGVPDHRSPIPFGNVTALNEARGGAARGTLRASTVRKIGSDERNSADVTFSLEQSILRERAPVEQLQPGGELLSADAVRWRGNTGITSQVNATLAGQVHLTGGMRLERDESGIGNGRWAYLPMLGAAWSRAMNSLTVKLRGAYGKGIRWPEIPARETLWEGLRTSARRLEPEEQSGVEAGIDLYVGNRFAVQVTRFDQVASGLIQRVAIARDTGTTPVAVTDRIRYELQNVGEITNRGWELQASFRRSPWLLAATFTQVHSRVRQLANGYTGDLRPGDRMLEVPERTVGLTAGWTGSRWRASLTASRAMDWVNYDRVALAKAFATTSRPTREFVGEQLRQFWKEYPGLTRVRASVGTTLFNRVGLTLSGDNLLDHQTGEPDNITVLPGRTVTFGVKTEF